MEKNYTNSPPKDEMPVQQPSSGLSMQTKILLAKIGLLICVIILIVAKTFSR